MLAALVWVTTATDSLVAAAAHEMYTAALAHERTLRAPNGNPVTLAQLRAGIARYEAIVREHPESGFIDHSLWQAAGLAVEAFQRHGRPSDRETAIRLLDTLRREYPSSELTPRIPGRLALMTLTLTSAAPAPAPAREPVRVRAVTREPLADVVRVTIELDDEVPYRSERLDGPDRLYFDLVGASAERSLHNATLAFEDGDIVRKIRLGRHPEQTTRVVLDLEGVESYRVFTLDHPYRLVVDAARTPARRSGGAPAGVADSRASLDRIANDAASTVSPFDGSELLPIPEGWSVKALAPIPPVDASTESTVAAASVEDAELAWPRVHGMLYPGLGTAPSSTRPAVEPASTAPRPAPPVTRDTLLDSPPVGSPAGPPGLPSLDASPRPARVDGVYSLGRQLGLGVTRVAIDPGHGGSDPGALTAGLSESALVLDIAERLAERLRNEGVEVVMTRRGDVSLPLRARTEIANRANADLFLSIHANAAPDPEVRGIETYHLDFASDPAAKAVAARENAATREGMHDLPVLIESITLRNKVDESRAFAELVQARLISSVRAAHPRVQDLGVKQAPFVVLIGASMPSVLAEISFLTNPEEAALLATGAYRDQIAEALFTSITEYQRMLKPGGHSRLAAASSSR